MNRNSPAEPAPDDAFDGLTDLAVAGISEDSPGAEEWDDERLLEEVTALEQVAIRRLRELFREKRGTRDEYDLLKTVAFVTSKVRMNRRAKSAATPGRSRGSVQEDLAAEVSRLAAGEGTDPGEADGG